MNYTDVVRDHIMDALPLASVTMTGKFKEKIVGSTVEKMFAPMGRFILLTPDETEEECYCYVGWEDLLPEDKRFLESQWRRMCEINLAKAKTPKSIQ